MKHTDLTGRSFGRWKVLQKAPRTYASMWMCRCACGVEKAVSAPNLTSGRSTSCGCYRDENRPLLSKHRDFSGAKNPRAKAAIQKYGEQYVPSNDVWYKRASGIWYTAKSKGVPVEFTGVQELASYAKSIAGETCPVFGVPFVARGAGFSKWSPSIDKIDPAKGYVRGNIQIISMLANCMKRDATAEELRVFAAWVMKGS